MDLLLYFEFTDGTQTKQVTFDDLRGIPIPTTDDCFCPGKGIYKIVKRTFAYGGTNLTVYFECKPVPEV